MTGAGHSLPDVVGSSLTLTPLDGLGTSLSLTRDITGPNDATVYYNIFNYTSDDAALAGAGSFGVGLCVSHTFGGDAMRGGREAFQAVAILDGATHGENENRNYVGGTFVGVARSGDGGTDLEAGARGAIFGANPYFDLQDGATNLLNASAAEFDAIAREGSSVRYKSIVQLCYGGPLDAVQGSAIDCMLALSATPGSAGGRDAILIGAMNGQFPIMSEGTLLRTIGSSVTDGIDFSTTAFSGVHFNFGNLTQANNNGLAIGGAPLTNHYLMATGNAATEVPPVGITTYGLTSNYSNALREFDLWNCDPDATDSFQFHQLTGKDSETKVFSIAPSGALTVFAGAAPAAPGAWGVVLYVDQADGKLKSVGPTGTITVLSA